MLDSHKTSSDPTQTDLTDHFRILGQAIRPWLDPEKLKADYMSRCAASHPDRVHHLQNDSSQKSAESESASLNTAYRILSSHKSRLQHLLGLIGQKSSSERGETIPNQLMDLFFELSGQLREADAVVSEIRSARSPILKARLFSKGIELLDLLEKTGKKIQAESDHAIRTLQELDQQWLSHGNHDLSSIPQNLVLSLKNCYLRLSFTSKWLAEIQERRLNLTL